MPFEKINTERVFYYFSEICKIPHGSGNMGKIADYCENFAKNHSLNYHRDGADNVIIYKPSKNYPNDIVILQGHIDMVCQKESDCDIDFLKDGIKTFTDGDFLKAQGTTLGADNGIAVAMILALLESDLSLPSIEAVFTTDEEIGMIGAAKLDTFLLKGTKMINLDSEEDDTLTVSCAGGSDFTALLPITHTENKGYEVTVTLKGLKGGHSGVEIDKKRVNANILVGRFLNHLKSNIDLQIISINGGDKANAIVGACEIKVCVFDKDKFLSLSKEYLAVIKNEISAREPNFNYTAEIGEYGSYKTVQESQKIISILLNCPNGIMEMSAEIEGLVETSLNLGVLKTENKNIFLQFALRSNKQSALDFLEQKLTSFFGLFGCKTSVGGKYPTWEFKENSDLQKLYIDTYYEQTNRQVKVEAIHAGLECAVFSDKIKNLDCIAIGPNVFDAHTVNESLSISSAEKIFIILIKLLQKLK